MDTAPRLTILITNYNTSHFVRLLLYALKNLSRHPFRVLVNDNGSKPSDVRQLISLARQYSNIFIHYREGRNEPGSIAHGAALDALMPHVTTPYTAVFDSDATVLRKDWDQLLISQLDERTKIIGTPIGKQWAHQKPSDFPFQFIVLFETASFMKLNISWLPQLDVHGAPLVTNNVYRDTAWELKVKYEAAGYRGKTLVARNTRRYHAGPFKALTGVVEYYTSLDDPIIFGSHFGRGHTSGQAKFKTGLYQVPLLGNFASRWQGQIEAQAWIKKCRKIIDSQ